MVNSSELVDFWQSEVAYGWADSGHWWLDWLVMGRDSVYVLVVNNSISSPVESVGDYNCCGQQEGTGVKG